MVAFCSVGAVGAALGGWFDSGDMLMARRQPEAALSVYRALEKAPDVPRDGLLFREAECEMELGNRERGVACYRQLLAAFPESAYAQDAEFRLSLDRMRSPDRRERRKAIADALDFCYAANVDARAEEAAVAVATACYADAWYRDAERVAAQMIGKRPDGIHARALRRIQRWSAYRAGNMERVRKLCAGAGDDEAAYLMAAAAMDEGRDEEALAGFSGYLSAHTNGEYRALAESASVRLLFAAATESERAGRPADAIAAYDRIVAGFPGRQAEEAMFRKAAVQVGAQAWADAGVTLGTLLATNAMTARRGPALYLKSVSSWKAGDCAAASNQVAEALATGLPSDCEREARYFLEFLTTNGVNQVEQDNHEQ